MSSYSLTISTYGFSVLKVFTFMIESFDKEGFEECKIQTPPTQAQVVLSVRIRAQHTPPNILTLILSGTNAVSTWQPIKLC